MKKKKNSSLKGLFLVIFILACVGSYIIWTSTRDNMIINVKVFDKKGTIPNVLVSIKDNKTLTQDNGVAKLHLRAGKEQNIIVKIQHNEQIVFDTVAMDEDRYITGYVNRFVLLK